MANSLHDEQIDPISPRDVDFSTRSSYCGELVFDDWGNPLNPMGRTGLTGRGILYKWGANHAADPIVIARSGDADKILLIKRQDSGQWALPGGMVDAGEKVSRTAKRELAEEAGVDVSEVEGVEVFAGYVDDPRNTDNSWMETAAFVFVVDFTPQPKASSDAVDAQWFDIGGGVKSLEEATGGLYASHAEIIGEALKLINE
ncbi:NUDIX domain-containing protein [Candidatus Saccharibacteria bacterium]|nr:NUDIX domain-containing protein [Candidatus Saccharibacteria bacterium]